MISKRARTHKQKEVGKKFSRKTKPVKVVEMTVEEQLKCFARIVVNQLFAELGLDEKE